MKTDSYGKIFGAKLELAGRPRPFRQSDYQALVACFRGIAVCSAAQ